MIPALSRIKIRDAVFEDISRLWEIDQACFKPGIAFAPDIFYYHILIQSDPAFAAEVDGEIIGFVLTGIEEDGVPVIITLDVLDGYRKLGIGKKLIDRAEEAIKGGGFKIVRLQAAVENDSAIRLYLKRGYKEVGLLEDYYGKGNHALCFEKTL